MLCTDAAADSQQPLFEADEAGRMPPQVLKSQPSNAAPHAPPFQLPSLQTNMAPASTSTAMHKVEPSYARSPKGLSFPACRAQSAPLPEVLTPQLTLSHPTLLPGSSLGVKPCTPAMPCQ
jgi:hypothetical protein